MNSKVSPKKMCLMIMLTYLTSMGGNANADFIFGTPSKLGPAVNSSASEGTPSVTPDGLELYFEYRGPGTHGNGDIYVSKRATTDDPWGEAMNLGPTVNGSYYDSYPSISADGLTLYFTSNRSGWDLWVTTRVTRDDPWGTPVNLGSPVNSPDNEFGPCISAEGLSLYFTSFRPGGFGYDDLWLTTRATTNDTWSVPVNLGPTINSSYHEAFPSISADGRMLFFCDHMGAPFRPGGYGGQDIWFTTRATLNDPWEEPVNVGSNINSSRWDFSPSISADGSTLYFASDRSGAGILTNVDIWQAPIEPIVDLNSDGIVDAADMCIIVDNWSTDEPLCDIGPMPWGDGIVDVQDLIVLAEHLFEETPPVEPVELFG
jgi:Tol biopolymer transport system component